LVQNDRISLSRDILKGGYTSNITAGEPVRKCLEGSNLDPVDIENAALSSVAKFYRPDNSKMTTHRVLERERNWTWPEDPRPCQQFEQHVEEVWLVGTLQDGGFEPSYRVFLHKQDGKVVGQYQSRADDQPNLGSANRARHPLKEFLATPIHHQDH